MLDICCFYFILVVFAMGELYRDEEIKKLYGIIDSMSKRLETLEGLKSGRNLIGQSYDSSGEIFDSGDTAWMLAATALVLLMTLPGLSLYYAGMAIRKQNVMTTAMQAFSTAGLVSLMWMFFGYSLTFETGSSVIGSHKRFWLANMEFEKAHPRAPTIPEPLHCAFQLTIAIVTACLMLGASADRMKYFSMLVFVCLWHLLVYCPIAHAHWATDGFLFKAGVLDYAGGNVVHIAAGISGMASSIVLGKRYGLGSKKFAPHNILYTITGACLLWIGWFGFNGGSAYGANAQASASLLMTQISTSAAAFSWMMIDYFVSTKITVLGLLSGAIAGLVSITPASGYVNSTGAFFIGLLSGPVCYIGVRLKQRMGFDDSLDAFGLHGIAGVYGGIMTGFFATKFGTKGAFYGNGQQLGLQLYGIVVSSGYSFIMTFIILFFIDLTLGVRVSLMAERFGLDRSVHGDGLYAERPADKTPQQHVAELLRSYAEASNQPVADFLTRYQAQDDEAISSLTDDYARAGGGGGGAIVSRLRNNNNRANLNVSDEQRYLPLTAAFLKMFAPPVDGYKSRLEAVGLTPIGVGEGEAPAPAGQEHSPHFAQHEITDQSQGKIDVSNHTGGSMKYDGVEPPRVASNTPGTSGQTGGEEVPKKSVSFAMFQDGGGETGTMPKSSRDPADSVVSGVDGSKFAAHEDEESGQHRNF